MAKRGLGHGAAPPARRAAPRAAPPATRRRLLDDGERREGGTRRRARSSGLYKVLEGVLGLLEIFVRRELDVRFDAGDNRRLACVDGRRSST